MCDAGGVNFAQDWLSNDCLQTYRDNAGFGFGIASVCFWLVAQLPQIIQNVRTKQAGALSPYFLGEWLLGDTSNLIGCLLTGTQLASQTYTAMYFVFMDTVLIVQYNYYTTIQRRHERRYVARQRQHAGHRGRAAARGSQGPNEVRIPIAAGNSGVSSREQSNLSTNVTRGRVLACVAFIAFVQLGVQYGRISGVPSGDIGLGVVLHRRLLSAFPAWDWSWFASPRGQWAMMTGQAMGYVSMLLYLGSRVSQIYKNWHRKSTEGLAMAMFMAAIMANVFYGSSIVVRTYTLRQLLDSLPWILGSFGTVGLDVCILYQDRLYSKGKNPESEAHNPLLANAGE